MSREKVLLKNTVIIAIGQFLAKFATFLLLPLYTYNLSTSQYGYYDLIITIVSLLTPFVSFQISDGIYRKLLDAENIKDKTNVISTAFSILGSSILVFNIFFIFVNLLFDIKYGYYILLNIDFNIFLVVCFQIARGLRSNITYSTAGVINAILNATLSVYFITVLDWSIEGLLLSTSLSSLATVTFIFTKLKILTFIKRSAISSNLRRDMVKYSMPLIPNSISWWIMNMSDRLLITFFIGASANGIYSVSNKLPSILIILNSILYLSWQETAISEYKAKDRNVFYTKIFNKLMVFQLTLCILLISYTKFLLDILVSDTYSSSWVYTPFLYLGIVFNIFSSFYGTGFLSAEKTKDALTSSIYGALANILLNLLLIPIMGVQGAAVSTMIAFITMWVIRIYQTRPYFKIEINTKKLLILLGLNCIFIILYFININLINQLLMIVSPVIFIIFNKEIIDKGLLRISPIIIRFKNRNIKTKC